MKTIAHAPLILLLIGLAGCFRSDGPPDAGWKANAVIDGLVVKTDGSLGDAQGVSYRDSLLYFYGDVTEANPRVGLIREYSLDLKPTGRDIWLRRQGKPLICHPTGLTWDKQFGCFLGDTIRGAGHIYQLDWDRALREGNLDNAVLTEIRDDAAVNGCRPMFVTCGGRRLLATADYGDVRPALRLYDPEKLVEAKRSGAPGVLVHDIPCGPFNQNLFWDEPSGRLTCVQNVVAGRGWQLVDFDLAATAEHDRIGDASHERTWVFQPHDELEGYLRLPDGRDVFVTSSPKENLLVGKIRESPWFATPAGSRGFKENGNSKTESAGSMREKAKADC